MQKKIPKLYYSISEVSKMTELKQYVLRYWETEFSQLKPAKNKAGNRKYTQKDVDLLFRIKHLLYENKFTIEGARLQLAKGSAEKISDAENMDSKKLYEFKKTLENTRAELVNLKKSLE